MSARAKLSQRKPPSGRKPAKRKQAGNLKALAKVRDKTKQHLKTGGTKRDVLTIPELEYCAWRAQGASITDSGRWAGISDWNLYRLEHKDIVQAKIAEMKKEFEADVISQVQKRREKMHLFMDGELMHRVRTAQTHTYRGDDSIAKMLDIGQRAVGAIQPAKNINQANSQSNAQNTNQIYAKRLYLPDWRRETIEKLQNDERNSGGSKVPHGTELPAS
jgi:hypothetical protein